MKPTITLLTLVAAAFVLTVSMTAPAQALSRTWVSGSGNDANPCTRMSPCATFSAAYAVTDAGGEINCVDAGSFGPLVITMSITISCEAGTAGIQASTSIVGVGIQVAIASTDVVHLRGLDINGVGAGMQTTGIWFTSAGTLHVEKCLIHGFVFGTNGFGIAFVPTGNAALFVDDTVIADNGKATVFSGGILSQPTSSANATVSLERVRLTNNGFGLDADGSNAGSLHVAIKDSLASGNANSGFIAETTGGRTTMMIKNSEASNNGTNGIKADGANAALYIGDSSISGNATGVLMKNSASLLSYKNDQIDLNSSNGTPVSQVNLN